MERRYKLMSKLGVRNLAGYNHKIDEAKAREQFIYNPFSLTPDSPEPLERLPFIGSDHYPIVADLWLPPLPPQGMVEPTQSSAQFAASG